MKTIKKVGVRPVFVEFCPEKEFMLEGHIYISKKYNSAIHLCLCGCKNETVTPLTYHQWTLTVEGEKISLSPSIGNFNFPCKSHYIITKNVANFV